MLNLRTQPLCRIKPQRQCFECFNLLAGLPWWLSRKESACSAGDGGSIPGSGRSSGEGNGNPLQYSCLGNPVDRGAWGSTVGVTKDLNTTYWLSNDLLAVLLGLPMWHCSKELPAIIVRRKTCRFDLWVRKIPWRREWQPTPVFLPGES